MSRSQRLFDLLQILRRHRYAVTANMLATELGISVRSVYRDIATLQQMGAEIEGEPGIGYVLRPSFMLPPLMFSEEEMEALVLGSRWVMQQGDARLASAAREALSKISAVLPSTLREQSESSGLLVPRQAANSVDENDAHLSTIRQAIRAEYKLEIAYCDQTDVLSKRTIWPFALGYFEQVRVLVAWCEQRQAFRHFRVDRIRELCTTQQRYPRRRRTLIQEWREEERSRSNPT